MPVSGGMGSGIAAFRYRGQRPVSIDRRAGAYGSDFSFTASISAPVGRMSSK